MVTRTDSEFVCEAIVDCRSCRGGDNVHVHGTSEQKKVDYAIANIMLISVAGHFRTMSHYQRVSTMQNDLLIG